VILDEVTRGGDVETDKGNSESEEGEDSEPIGFLVANILLLVVLCGLFGYLVYVEKQHRDLKKAKPEPEIPKVDGV
jgi:hypothetical protein